MTQRDPRGLSQRGHPTGAGEDGDPTNHGLTPREFSSGLKRNLGRISKRGDGYLRTLLIHGARSVLSHTGTYRPDDFREWAHKLWSTHVHNKAAVVVANKLARIIWAVWAREKPFEVLRKAA
jgi:transposase